jgi:hypothetical protein
MPWTGPSTRSAFDPLLEFTPEPEGAKEPAVDLKHAPGRLHSAPEENRSYRSSELDAIRTPAVKSPKPGSDIEQSGLSGKIPVVSPGKPSSRLFGTDESNDTESGARAKSSALRFDNARGGSETKRLIMIGLVCLVLLGITGTIGFMLFKHFSQGSTDSTISRTPAAPLAGGGSNAKPASGKAPLATTSSTPVGKPTRTGQKPDRAIDTQSDTKVSEAPAPPATTSVDRNDSRRLSDSTPASAPTSPGKEKGKSTAVAKVRKKPAKKKKTAVAKAPAPAKTAEAPAAPRRRRAYSTLDSYYGAGGSD